MDRSSSRALTVDGRYGPSRSAPIRSMSRLTGSTSSSWVRVTKIAGCASISARVSKPPRSINVCTGTITPSSGRSAPRTGRMPRPTTTIARSPNGPPTVTSSPRFAPSDSMVALPSTISLGPEAARPSRITGSTSPLVEDMPSANSWGRAASSPATLSSPLIATATAAVRSSAAICSATSSVLSPAETWRSHGAP